MKPSSLRKVALVCLLSLTLIGCTGAARQAQQAAGESLGRTAAQVTIKRQPSDCGKSFPDLQARVGEELAGLLKRYIEYVRGPINERTINCFWFNENQRIGLMGQ